MLRKGNRHIKALTALEYCMLVGIIAGSLAVSSLYIRRSLQGRWKEAVDQLGAQYEPGATELESDTFLNSRVYTRIERTGDEIAGYHTNRIDNMFSNETKFIEDSITWE